ncbi:MAG TPA: hypothetical protein VKW04_03655 [Planctomycetota bacterium]|nr:hypothetical protein [Planctomycetota bacterium]
MKATLFLPALLALAPQSEREVSVRIGEGEIEVVLPSRETALSREQILGWVKGCGETVADYFGKFPVDQVRLEISARRGDGVRNGRTWNGALIRIQIGTTAKAEELRDDWMLTHEMCHLAFPDLDTKFAWMYEGYATYVEPIARVRSGRMTVETMWKETLEGMPKGLPEPKDPGLDGTRAWGRTYWGGAYFWMKADLEIRDRTKNKASLGTALRAILQAGGNGAQRWTPDQVVEKGDEATGTTVLRELYKELGQACCSPDFPALWKQLGVERRGEEIVFDDQAPKAALRRALTAK